MIYPSDFEKKLGFDTIRENLAAKCVTQMGKDEVAEMSFSNRFELIRRRLHCVEEMRTVYESKESMPAQTIYDVLPSLSEIKAQGSFMSGDKLLRLGRMLDAMCEVRDFFCSEKDEEENTGYRFPELAKIFEPLRNFSQIRREIDRCINKFGDVKDTASDALYEVRRRMNEAQGSMSRAMKRVLERAVSDGIVDKDTVPTVRDGRLVIPLAAMSKRRLNGIIHDESATGKTVFIEPAEVVEAANRLRELEMEERREITAVLISIANVIRPEISDIRDCCLLLGHLDFIRAKAKYALEVGAQMPVLEKGPEIEWYHAVHPVLLLTLRPQNREVVPLDLHLDPQHRILVISGPNAGGKSVCLKTAGVIQYMTQCGILPTLYSNSHVGVFRKMFIDIGDQQSMENDLSTYSSHLRNMKFFLQNADKFTFFLADEMGSGTEPQIGGALAQSILGRLVETGCYGIVTTHYQNIKKFAEESEGVINGAMLYDRQHLRPTFELSVGNPGSSFAIEIARNIGLPAGVIDSARDIVGQDYVNSDRYLLEIARDRRYWTNKRQSIREKEVKLDNLLEKYEDTATDLKSRRAEIIRDARREAKEILATANARIENAIRDIRAADAEKERTKKIRQELEQYKASLNEENKESEKVTAIKELRHKSKASSEKKKLPRVVPKADTPLAAGDYVKMTTGGVSGRILSIQGNKAEVAFGGLRTFVELSKLKPVGKPESTPSTQMLSVGKTTSDEIRKRQLNFKTEIDVRGMRTDEAIQAVTYFIDDAIQFSTGKVRILHGTGHGILKTMIRQYLNAIPGVRRYYDEDVRFGGSGITIVELD